MAAPGGATGPSSTGAHTHRKESKKPLDNGAGVCNNVPMSTETPYDDCPRCHRKRPCDRPPTVDDCWCTAAMLDEYGTIREPEGE